ncbi:hypothetical protein [Rhodoplanes roseus]|uniref:Uncharacterized protein n=1 Tax=Rhodoplanes roseus TaxID=29409 RepID=A0A327KL79_9BRAD|nr:hypothetical protein [Rhodoplanes roseus]RAI38283.1 hypothetical protein CH341_28190 [Rhodoplanes roseus]
MTPEPRPSAIPLACEIVSRLRAIRQPTRVMAADLIERLDGERRELHRTVLDADRGFEAALAAGWLDALAAGDVPRLADLWQRHLSPARHALAAAAAPRTETERSMAHG